MLLLTRKVCVEAGVTISLLSSISDGVGDNWIEVGGDMLCPREAYPKSYVKLFIIYKTNNKTNDNSIDFMNLLLYTGSSSPSPYPNVSSCVLDIRNDPDPILEQMSSRWRLDARRRGCG